MPNEIYFYHLATFHSKKPSEKQLRLDVLEQKVLFNLVVQYIIVFFGVGNRKIINFLSCFCLQMKGDYRRTKRR